VSKRGIPLKSGYLFAVGLFSMKLLQIGTDMLLIMAMSFLEMSTSMTLNDLEPSK